MSSGYVLNFSDHTFSQFFKNDFNIDIDNKKYHFKGSSKANRLRAFWELEQDELVGKVLSEILEFCIDDNVSHTNIKGSLLNECKQIVSRLLKKPIIDSFKEESFFKEEVLNLLKMLQMDVDFFHILELRVQEFYKCIEVDAPLAAIILCGSILEGVLIEAARQNPKEFNQANASPKDNQQKVKQFQKWNLESLINVAHEIGFLKLNIKEYVNFLREFRNCIHPLEQFTKNFDPDIQIVKINFQVLKAAITSLAEHLHNKNINQLPAGFKT